MAAIQVHTGMWKLLNRHVTSDICFQSHSIGWIKFAKHTVLIPTEITCRIRIIYFIGGKAMPFVNFDTLQNP